MNEHSPDSPDSPQRRALRSFVLRASRTTPAQRKAIEQQWEKHGIDIHDNTTIDPIKCFGHEGHCTLEIGFGMGTSLAEMAKASPEQDFIGIEVHPPGLGNLLKLIEAEQIENLKIIRHDAMEVVKAHIKPASLDRILIYFPDPWPKKKHHKRRIIQPQFIKELALCLKPNGILHLATDWEDYALHMQEVMQQASDYETTANDGSAFVERPDFRPITKFENRGLKLGHSIWDLIYKKIT